MNDKEKFFEKVLKALANRRRLAILKYLKKSGSASVGNIARKISLSFRATSRHLSVLYNSDILEKKSVSLSVFYSLAPNINPKVKSIISSLLD